MENINHILAMNILKYRKKMGMSQEALALKLGVTFQAVSKWETEKSAPDIGFLPRIADVFNCNVDDLFSRKSVKEIAYEMNMPWEDDDTIRIFQTKGRKIMQNLPWDGYIEVRFPRNCNETTRQYFRVEVYGNLMADASINGDVICHGRLECNTINGDVTAQGDISAYQINSFGDVVCRQLVKKEET